MFSNLFLKSFRILLLPFALMYWLIISLRNWMYNKKILPSVSFGLPVICVGNLSVGGTGKSPMVEYLIRLLQAEFKIATLSRGYKRRTRGYVLADNNSTALDIGDEPQQFHEKFPSVPVTVGEKRVEAIPQLLHDHPETECIILDDAFQHRAVVAGLNILLTDYNNLFTRDFYLPTGDLRDLKSGYKMADLIVVTKCDPKISEQEKLTITEEISPLPQQHVFFTANSYSHPYHILDKHDRVRLSTPQDILLITGIANPAPLKHLLELHAASYNMMHFPDHHIFTIDDWRDIQKKFAQLQGAHKIILTTEKDAVRLSKFSNEMKGLPLYVIPLEHFFLFEEENKFQQLVLNFIKNFKKPVNLK
ncbi:MAG: tetraacyldisaccharide 4'-kinase [Terrimonas sp.]|nr:tetraacyldisaccharide 4'-kinase [Terrimonas sp.]